MNALHLYKIVIAHLIPTSPMWPKFNIKHFSFVGQDQSMPLTFTLWFIFDFGPVLLTFRCLLNRISWFVMMLSYDFDMIFLQLSSTDCKTINMGQWWTMWAVPNRHLFKVVTTSSCLFSSSLVFISRWSIAQSFECCHIIKRQMAWCGTRPGMDSHVSDGVTMTCGMVWLIHIDDKFGAWQVHKNI